MFSLTNPWILLSLILCLLGTYGAGHHAGYEKKEAEDTAVIAAKNTDMQTAKEKSDAELHKVQTQLTAAQSKLHDAILSGDQRLYVRVATPTECAASASGDSTTTAQLDPEFAATLTAITDRGDQAIVQLNACIKQYDEMREIVNDQR